MRWEAGCEMCECRMGFGVGDCHASLRSARNDTSLCSATGLYGIHGYIYHASITDSIR